MPVRDLSCPEELKRDEQAFRYHFWKLTKIGNWIAELPVTIGDIGEALILKVRRDEAIPVPLLRMSVLARLFRSSTYYLKLISVGARILHVAVWHPTFTRKFERFVYQDLKRQISGPNGRLDAKQQVALDEALEAAHVTSDTGWPGIQPLFGWRLWATAAALYFGVIAFSVVEFTLLLAGNWLWSGAWLGAAGLLTAYLLPDKNDSTMETRLRKAAARLLESKKISPFQMSPVAAEGNAALLKASAMKAASIDLSLISNYPLKRRLYERFRDPGKPGRLIVNSNQEAGTQLVIVAAVLQELPDVNQQAWAKGRNLSLVDSLATACAMGRVFPPTHIEANDAGDWIREKDLDALEADGDVVQQFDLIDGAVIRKNPLPALFNWLQEEDNARVAGRLESDNKTDARIHVIYGVPIEPFDADDGKPGSNRIDLVDSANVGILMRARRDTTIEVRQTNYLSKILNAQKKVARHTLDGRFAIFADEIAPERELNFKNSLSPTREEGLRVVAEGCRRTLGRLFESELAEDFRAEVPCKDLLDKVASKRMAAASSCGLPEVCAVCSGNLKQYPTPKTVPDIVKQDFGKLENLDDLKTVLPNLCAPEKHGPKITFVASGGVFAGSFHIGLIGALQALNRTPDLIVGASVGTLMGGALAAIRNSKHPGAQFRLLARLTDIFLRVDETVALTVPLKTAVKQLGLRSLRLALSPSALRAAVRAGTAHDSGYAATGVPPLVTDTLSQLFIIPPAETFRAGSSFLAGRFAKAAGALITLVRRNTLESLGIRYEVIGTSLLENVAKGLMEGEEVIENHREFKLNQRQPYIRKKTAEGTAIFCTTAYVNQRWLLVLGRDALFSPSPDYSFLHAALSSSAFPAAFPARQEREVFPGEGKINNLFCDGGTFDNLPFMPTVELLSQTQAERFRLTKLTDSSLTVKQFLDQRLEAPDLILSGGFDPAPANDRRMRFESQSDISARAAELGSSVKTDSFIAMSRRVAKHLRLLSAHVGDRPTAETEDIMKRAVVAGVVNLVPSSEWHVNPTFGFSRTLGLEPERVTASIANGCFQTLMNLQQRRYQKNVKHIDVLKSLRALKLDVERRKTGKVDGRCHYFEVPCPFHRAASEIAASPNEPDKVKKAAGSLGIYDACGNDPVHQRLFQIDGMQV